MTSTLLAERSSSISRDARARQLVHDQLADVQILVQLLGVVALREPLRFPVADDAQAESDRIDFTSH